MAKTKSKAVKRSAKTSKTTGRTTKMLNADDLQIGKPEKLNLVGTRSDGVMFKYPEQYEAIKNLQIGYVIKYPDTKQHNDMINAIRTALRKINQSYLVRRIDRDTMGIWRQKDTRRYGNRYTKAKQEQEQEQGA